MLVGGQGGNFGPRVVTARTCRHAGTTEAVVYLRSKDNRRKYHSAWRYTLAVRFVVGIGCHNSVESADPSDADFIHLAGLGVGSFVYEDSLRYNHDGS